MNWIVDAFWARIGWALGEIAIFVAVIGVVAVLALLISIPKTLRQYRCKHIRYYETGSCDAICDDCGKHLGFIGSIRDRADKAEVP